MDWLFYIFLELLHALPPVHMDSPPPNHPAVPFKTILLVIIFSSNNHTIISDWFTNVRGEWREIQQLAQWQALSIRIPITHGASFHGLRVTTLLNERKHVQSTRYKIKSYSNIAKLVCTEEWLHIFSGIDVWHSAPWLHPLLIMHKDDSA